MESSVAVLPNEQALVSRAAIDPAAFATIYDHYFAKVYNYVRYRVVHPETADDLTAQVFERAPANLTSYRPERAPFAAWLFAITRNAVNGHLRAQKRRPRRRARDAADNMGSSVGARSSVGQSARFTSARS